MISKIIISLFLILSFILGFVILKSVLNFYCPDSKKLLHRAIRHFFLFFYFLIFGLGTYAPISDLFDIGTPKFISSFVNERLSSFSATPEPTGNYYYISEEHDDSDFADEYEEDHTPKWIYTDDSTAFSRIGYDSLSDLLYLDFRTSGLYVYFDVPPGVWEQMKEAESKGRFFHAEIRDNYEYLRLD